MILLRKKKEKKTLNAVASSKQSYGAKAFVCIAGDNCEIDCYPTAIPSPPPPLFRPHTFSETSYAQHPLFLSLTFGSLLILHAFVAAAIFVLVEYAEYTLTYYGMRTNKSCEWTTARTLHFTFIVFG